MDNDDDELNFYHSEEYQKIVQEQRRLQREQNEEYHDHEQKRSRYNHTESKHDNDDEEGMKFISTLSIEEQEEYWLEHAMLESKRMLRQQQEEEEKKKKQKTDDEQRRKLQEARDAQLAAAMVMSESGTHKNGTEDEIKVDVIIDVDNDDDEDLELRRALEASREEERRRQIMLRQQWEEEERRRKIEERRRRQEEEEKRRIQQEQLKEDEALAAATEDSERHAVSKELQHIMNDMANEWSQTSQQERNLGSWDCPSCTFTNKPYTAKCRACHTAAPTHVLVFEKLPSMIRFGLEIEMLIPHGRRDGFSLRSIAENLTFIGPPKVQYMGYTHETTKEWKIVTDSSIGENNPDEDLAFELVSPILQGDDGLDSLRLLMENVRKLGIATNASCGFHVHVDAEEGEEDGDDDDEGSPCSSLKALKRICQCFVSLENAFDLLVSLSWDTGNNDNGNNTINDNSSHSSNRRGNNNRYCRSNRLAFGESSSKQRWEKINSCSSKQYLITKYINPNGDRYRKLNLTNIVKPNRPSTIEFRQHGGVIDVIEAEAWVRLVITFCHHASLGGPNVKKCLLPERRHGVTPIEEVNALFRLLSCHGLEQFFRMERKLFITKGDANSNNQRPRRPGRQQAGGTGPTINDRLLNPWQCTTCRKVFATSRSLSQHCLALNH